MLVTRQCDTGRNTWSPHKLASYSDIASPRMSNFESLPPQPDWRGQYPSFALPGDSNVQSALEQTTRPNLNGSNINPQSHPRQIEHRHSLAQLRESVQSTSNLERPGSAPLEDRRHDGSPSRDETLLSRESAMNSLHPNRSLPSLSSASMQSEETLGTHVDAKEEEDEEEDDDDEMLDAEESSTPLTAAERRAERRKMKRFRLTHQQTRFLMSEFAKQAHPDAAHRERLSREIPGLSPRQVQVWFQNRRAKIKRLTADDRERMMKMRAVPDDFDNVQALHSPYGAVHGVGTPMPSPVNFVPTYADHLIRPLMVDTMRRNENDEQHLSPGLNPAFGQVGFSPGPSMLSPMSMSSSDRYYSSHLSSPMSSGPQSSNPFERQNSYHQSPGHSRQNMRSLQPLQLRETMNRSRSDSLQSPLRSSMSWKGETLDYANFQAGQLSPQSNGRRTSAYNSEQIGGSSVNASQYEANAYSNTNIQQSPPQISFSPPRSAGFQQSAPSAMSRLRASSSAFPPGLDLRAQSQYRNLSTLSPHTALPSSSRSSTFPGLYASSGYASAPLAAPVDFSLPRTPTVSRSDFNIPQLSAPMAAPQDFSAAYNRTLSPASNSDRDFGSQHESADAGNVGPSTMRDERQHSHQQQQDRSNDNYVRSDDYEASEKRKRSFTMPGMYEPQAM